MLRRRHVISRLEGGPVFSGRIHGNSPVARSARSFPVSRNTEKAAFRMRYLLGQFSDVKDSGGDFACHSRWQAADNVGTHWPHGRCCARSTDAWRRCVQRRISSGCGEAISSHSWTYDSSISPNRSIDVFDADGQTYPIVGAQRARAFAADAYTATAARIAGWDW